MSTETAKVVAKAIDDISRCRAKISLDSSKIGDEGAKRLADPVAQSESLQELYLPRNAIGDEGAKALTDAVASLWGNRIGALGAEALADAVQRSNSLQVLYLSENRIGDEGAKALADAMAQNMSLQGLDLVRNSIGSKGARALADAVKQSASLQFLYLSRNNIGDEGAKALADGLAQSKSLLKLYLTSNSIRAFGARALADGMAQSKSLQTLRLQGNNVGAVGAKALAVAMAQSKSLQTLVLDQNSIGDEGAEALADGMMQSKSLQTLRLQGNNVGAAGAKALAVAMAQSKSLQTLVLDQNSVGNEGASALADAMAQCKSLQTLRLRKNGVGDEGAKALADAVAQSKSLQTLILGINSIGVDGAKALADGLALSKSLQTLDLHDNSIGDEGAEALADAVAQNRSLQMLHLGTNSIGDMGTKALAGALEHNKSVLQTLELRFNSIGAAGAAALADALETNDMLQELFLPSGISDEVTKRIGDRLKLAEDEINALSASALEALKADGKARWGRAKLMVVGKGAAGKTSTIRTLLGQPVVFEHDSTIGVDLKLMHTRDWEERLHISDADLGEQFAKNKYRRPSSISLSKRLSRSVARASLPRDTASPPALMRFDEKEVSRVVQTPLRVRIKEHGGKVDEEVSFTIWDYGGQEVFYALHHLFLTQYGVYVLVFDMREVLGKERLEGVLDMEELDRLASQEEALETLRFWLDSIRVHAPGVAVALVGTYLDQVPDLAQHLEIQKTLLDKLLKVKGLRRDVHIQRNTQGDRLLQFFPIDNVDREDAAGRAANLRNVLTKSVAGKRFVKEKVPLRWSYCLDLLLKGNVPYMTLEQVETLAQERCYVAAEGVGKMLEFMHELGVLVHMKANDTLRKVVVLRPQWLLDNLSRVICDRDTDHMEKHKEGLLKGDEGREELPHDLEEALDEWTDRGVASRALLEWLWQGEPVDYLTSLMEAMLLASPSPWIRSADGEDGDDEGADEEGALLVPSMLRVATQVEREGALDLLDHGALAYVEFKFLPKGVFQHFVANTVKSFVGLATVRQKIFLDLASINFDGVECVMEASSRRVTFIFGGRKQWARLPPLLTLLRRNLDEIDRSFMKGRLEPKLYVSFNGSDDDSACVLLEKLARPEGDCWVLSRDKNVQLPLGAFVAFVHDAAQAQELQDAMTSTETPSYDVFLSHAWGPGKRTHAKVVAVAEGLEKLRISCWLDAKDVGSDVFKSMADGIDRSSASVVFVTREYMDKVNKDLTQDDNCRLEFHYAMNRHKSAKMIPCVLDLTMTDTSDWKGSFGFRWSGNPLFVPMLSDGGPTDEELAELAQRIREVINQD